MDSSLARLVMAKGSSTEVRAVRNPRLKLKSSHLSKLKKPSAADLEPDEVVNLSSQFQLSESTSQSAKGAFQMNNQNFIPIRPKGQKPVVLKVLKGPNIPGGPRGPAIAKVEGGSGAGPGVVVLQGHNSIALKMAQKWPRDGIFKKNICPNQKELRAKKGPKS